MRFTYTWKEIQASNGYILHGLHNDDIPVELVTTTSSPERAVCTRAEETAGTLQKTSGIRLQRQRRNTGGDCRKKVQTLKASGSPPRLIQRGSLRLPTQGRIFTSSNAWKLFSMLLADEGELEDEDWEEQGGGDFQSYLENARPDGIRHLETGGSGDLFPL
ncbi:MAG: hypothetical protein ACLUD2_20785 [Clostridium sp.]